MSGVAGREEYTEWRVETDQTEDDFGTDEAAARDWLAECENNPDWMPAWLLRRTVVTEITEWEKA